MSSYVFENSGPTHLSSVDWTSPEHQRCVAASLVQGTYAMNHYRPRSDHPLAQEWWSFFQFQLKKELIDAHRSIFGARRSIFGAIYEYIGSAEHAPRFVVAFRGTQLNTTDLKLDMDLIKHHLHKTSRCKIAKDAIDSLRSENYSSSKIWLAGHSLGASVATVVGKSFAHTEVLLESFLFNPPFISLPTNLIKNKKLRKLLVTLKIAMKLLMTELKKDEGSSSVDSFDRMSSWIPNLFVNHKDVISTGYIDYFENRKAMEERGMGGIARLTAPQSIRATIRKAFGKECEPVYLLPSANLLANKSNTNDFLFNHGIEQWWAHDMDLNHNQYRYQ